MICINSVTVYPSNATITKGQWYYGAWASISSDCPECAEVRWYSNNNSIASVNATTGYIYAVNTGTTRIYAEATDGSGKKDYITVTVTAPVAVTGIQVCPTSKTMNVGDTNYLCATVYPSNATNKSVTWCSSDESVAEINTYTGFVRAKKAGIVTITAYTVDGGYSDSCELWVHGKTPVFLIHGRTSNSFGVWGAGNRIFVDPLDTSEADNNHFDSSINALSQGNVQLLYTNKYTQDIFGYQTGQTIKVDGTNVSNFNMPGVFNGEFDDGKYTSQHPEGGNLAYYLKQRGYTENINMFVFNYPNEDAVKYSAQKFEAYINNLISYVRSSGTNEMKACFYASRSDYNNNNYKINIVGHSMGGLVARYYIENLYHDYTVDKLVTICTPHWGSGYGNASSIIGGGLHKLCDHDLDKDSAMFGGNNSINHNCNALFTNCYNGQYVLTDELLYNRQRNTKYYAIACIDFDEISLDNNDYPIEIPATTTTFNQLTTLLDNNGIGFIFWDTPLTAIGDNMVGFLSQIGWTETGDSTPTKRIDMEKIYTIVDTRGGYSAAGVRLHSVASHKNKIMEQVVNYLI